MAVVLTMLALGLTARIADSANGDTSTNCDPFTAATAINNAPLAIDDDIWVTPGNTHKLDVLANDIDFDFDDLSVELATTPSAGKLNILDGTVSFAAPDSLEAQVAFQYRVTDGRCGSDTGTVRVTVTNQPRPQDQAVVGDPQIQRPQYTG
jgi:hypothetical protein